MPVNGGTIQALSEWLAVRGDALGPLFYAIGKGGWLLPGRPTPQMVRKTLLKRRKAAQVETPFTAHDFRRTFAGDMLEEGADIATVQRLAGHANVTTTARYDRRGEAVKREAIKRHHVPFVAAKRRVDARVDKERLLLKHGRGGDKDR